MSADDPILHLIGKPLNVGRGIPQHRRAVHQSTSSW
jgi:hypothetical protein